MVTHCILAHFCLQIRYEETEAELEEEVDILMSSDIVAVQMSTKAITLDRAQSGWLFRKDRSELIGAFRVGMTTGRKTFFTWFC